MNRQAQLDFKANIIFTADDLELLREAIKGELLFYEDFKNEDSKALHAKYKALESKVTDLINEQ